MMHNIRLYLGSSAVAAMLLLCCSCAWLPLRTHQVDTPEKFSLYSEEPMDSTNRWWENFQSLELSSLIDESLTNSPTIEQAWARLEQAEAVAKKAGAAITAMEECGATRVNRHG